MVSGNESQFQIKDILLKSVKLLLDLIKQGEDIQRENIETQKRVCIGKINNNLNDLGPILKRRMILLEKAILKEDWNGVENIYKQLKP